MSKYIGTPVVSLSTDTVDVTGDITTTDATPEVIIVNDTHEDTDGGREGKVTFKGQQSGGEETTLAQIQASHDGTSDDQKGDLIFKTNDGSDGASPTEAMRIQSDQKIGVGLSSNISSTLHVNSELSLGPDNNNRIIVGSTSGGVGSIGTIEAGTASFSTMTFKGGNVGIGTSAPLRQLSLSNTGNAEMSFISGTSSNASILFGDGLTGTDVYKGYIQFQHANDAMTFATSAAERMRIDSSGKLLVNTTTNTGGTITTAASGLNLANSPLETKSTTTGSGTVYAATFFNGSTASGHILVDGAATTYATSSDYRLKENVTDISDGITRVKQLEPKRFNWIADENNTTIDGFIAHEAQTVVPEAVSGKKDAVEVWVEGEELPDGVSIGDNKLDDDGNTIPTMQGIDQAKLVPLLTAALQEAIAKIETLETKVAALEGE